MFTNTNGIINELFCLGRFFCYRQIHYASGKALHVHCAIVHYMGYSMEAAINRNSLHHPIILPWEIANYDDIKQEQNIATGETS